MILVEDAQSLRVSHGPSSGPVQLSSDAYHTTPLLPPPSYPKHRPTPPAPAVHPPPSPLGRFCKAFTLALLLYLAILALVLSMASGGTHRLDGPGVPRADDGSVLRSIGPLDWSTYPSRPRWAPNFSESAETSFTLPIASEELYLISRGSYQDGTVHVTQSTERGDVKVDVRVAYHNERALARATVCRLQRSGNRDGVGIYTPTSRWSDLRDQLYFDIVFTLPAATSESAPLRINAFTTHTGGFAHEIADLWQSVLFENVDINSSNSHIQANSITLTRGSLTTSNGHIVGHFNTSDSLTLHTSNAHIEATASLFNAGAHPTELDMRTSNSRITASVSLITASGSGGDFIVSSRSSNGAIKLQYEDAPLRARLVSSARTSNSRASVAMHPAFEGTYEVSTSNSHPVIRDTRPADPSGADRRRIVTRTTSGGTTSGTVYWVGDERVEGTCEVHTSNARASLDL